MLFRHYFSHVILIKLHFFIYLPIYILFCFANSRPYRLRCRLYYTSPRIQHVGISLFLTPRSLRFSLTRSLHRSLCPVPYCDLMIWPVLRFPYPSQLSIRPFKIPAISGLLTISFCLRLSFVRIH